MYMCTRLLHNYIINIYIYDILYIYDITFNDYIASYMCVSIRITYIILN